MCRIFANPLSWTYTKSKQIYFNEKTCVNGIIIIINFNLSEIMLAWNQRNFNAFFFRLVTKHSWLIYETLKNVVEVTNSVWHQISIFTFQFSITVSNRLERTVKYVLYLHHTYTIVKKKQFQLQDCPRKSMRKKHPPKIMQ